MSVTRNPIERVAAAVAIAVVALGTLTACGGAPGGGGIAGGVADDSWTVMTYMIADTNLEYFQMEDMREQEAVGSRPGFNLISYLDRSDDYSDEDVLGLGDFTGAKVIEVKRSGGSQVVDTVGESNTGDPDVLAGFISSTIQQFPAAHYALIINDHGSSWPGVGADGSADNDQLTLAELQQGIAAGLDGGKVDKLDMIGFDACLMATYETASTLQTLADRMIASQELEPGYGWDYTSLETAARGGDVDELAASILKAYDEQSTSEGESQVTLAEIDLTKLPAIDEAIDAFTAGLSDDLASAGSDIGRALTNSLAYGATPDYNFYMTDLGQLAGQLGGPGDALAAAIDDSIIAKVDGQATRGASGMAIYFPPQQGAFNDKYTQVEAAAGWTGFLKAYYAAGQAGNEKPTFASSTAQSGFQNGGFVVAQQITSPVNQITDTKVYYGYVESGTTVLIGDEKAYIDEDNYAVGFFDTYQLWVGDGSNETSFYSSFEANQDSDVATIGVPIYYTAGSSADTQGFLQMTYAPSTGTILSETFYGQDESGAFSEISPESGATFEALKIRYKSDGGLEYFRSSKDIEISADTDTLQFGYRKLDSGTRVYAEVYIENSAGAAAISSATGVIP